MKYYKLWFECEVNDFVMARDADIGDMDRYITEKGEYIKNWDKLTFGYDSKEGENFTDNLYNVYDWCIISSKCQRLFNGILSERDVQYLDVSLQNINDGRICNDYHIVNILNKIDALDFDRSDCEYLEVDDKKILMVSLPVLRSESVEGYDIFRLQEYEIPIFVSERIKQIVEKNNLTGFMFWEVPVV